MKKKLLSTLLVFGAALGANAQSIPTEWSGRFQTVIDSLTTSYQSADGEPIGISMALNVPGIGTWKGVSGVTAPGVPMTTTTTNGIASNSKLFTATILLKLQEANILSLDDEIGDWIQEPLNNVDKTATIRQLLHHETGVFDFTNDSENVFDYVLDDVDHFWNYSQMIDSIGPGHFPKGTAHRYSNTGYVLAAWIIEEATGNSYAHNLHQYITTPLNLNRTFDAATETVTGNPEGSSYFFGNWYLSMGTTAYGSMLRGSGSIVSTPEDMTLFYQAVFNGTFLSAASKQQLLTFDPASEYGLGVSNYYSYEMQHAVYEHTGSVVGYQSEATYDPVTGASMFWVINNDAYTAPYSLALRKEFAKGFPKQVNDAGITRIISPRSTICNGAIIPKVVLKNHGSSTLTSVVINYQIDNNSPQSYSWTGSLASGATSEVSVTPISATGGQHTLNVWTTAPNGATEGYAFNDMQTTELIVVMDESIPASFSEDFEGETTAVMTWNPNHITAGQWDITKLTGSSGNHSLARNPISQSVPGDESFADLPMIQLGSGMQELRFTYAYRDWQEYNEKLEVLLSADCGTTWTSIWSKEGLVLSQGVSNTYENGSRLYFPHTEEEWHSEAVSLNAYNNMNVLVRFREVTANGANIYLDDISVGLALGIADNNKNIINVYPNPASDKVTVTGLPESTVVSLYNVSGQKLIEVLANGDKAIDISGLAKGMYFLNTVKGSAKIIKK